MADQKTATNAVVYLRGIPHYELTASEIAYPIVINQNGQDWRVPFFLSPYKAQDFKDTLRDLASDWKIEGDETELPVLPTRPYREFVDKYFLRLGGTNIDDPAKHRSYLDKYPYLKDRVFQEGIQGASDNNAGSSRDDDLFALDLEERERRIPTVRKLFVPDKGREEDVETVHVIRTETEHDYSRWRQAMRQAIRGGRHRKQIIRINYDILEQLYDSMVLRLEGFLAGGKKCNEDNAREWKPLVPLAEKFLAVDIAFERTQRKNV